MKKTIAVDHGNRLIKTTNHVFPANCIDGTRLASVGGDTLKYNGKEVVLTNDLQLQLNDKTIDDRYYNLNLAAIAKELAFEEASTGVKYSSGETIEITLLIGLPLAHCKELGPKYVDYFKQCRPLTFEFNGKFYNIHITKVMYYPQGVSAVFATRDNFKGLRDVYVADIGGFTLDGFRMTNQKGRLMPDPTSCISLYCGVNRLFDRTNAIAHSKGSMHDIPVGIMEGFLRKDVTTKNEITPKRSGFITTAAMEHTEDMLSQLSHNGCDLEEDFIVFMGGGSLLLEDYVLQSNRLTKGCSFINNIKANVEGYSILHTLEEKSKSTPASNVTTINRPTGVGAAG